MSNIRFGISVLQHVPTPGDLTTSLSRIETALADARQAGSRLLVVPEASLTGYNLTREMADDIAVEADAPLFETLSEHCARNAVGAVVGYIERENDTLYNTARLIDTNGDTLTRYRKTHLWGSLDRGLFRAGPGFVEPVEFDGIRLAMLICYDVEFPEAVRHLALAGAELLIVPTALMQPWPFVARHLVPVRAAESQLFIAYANYCGHENGLDYTGESCIVGPDGTVLVRASDGPELISATLELGAMQKIRKELPYFRDRRPSLYSALARGSEIFSEQEKS